MQFSDIQLEHSASVPTRSIEFDAAAVNRALDDIDAGLDDFAGRLAARGFAERRVAYRVDAHYAAQVWDISVELPAPRFASQAEVDALIEGFHAKHRRIFSVDDPASPIEFLNWTGRLSVALPQTAQAAGVDGASATVPVGRRRALFDVDDVREAAIYRGDAIRAGDVIPGPAIIEEATTTIVLPPGTEARLTPAGSYVVELRY
jgi:N-methylhydantoinase A